MKTNEQIEKVIREAVEAHLEEGKATAETITAACAAVQEKATAKFGPGVYVTGKLNADEQCVIIYYKRPSIRQRLTFAVPASVDKPEHNPDAPSQAELRRRQRIVDAQNDDDSDPGAPQDKRTRLEIMLDIANTLNKDQFTGDGRPHVDALNDGLAEGDKPFTAAERDALWAKRPAV